MDMARFNIKIKDLSKQELVTLRHQILTTYREKYRKKYDQPLYGNLPRNMSIEYIKSLMQSMKEEHKKIFMIQFFYALRVGELKDIILLDDTLVVHNHKMNRKEYLPIFNTSRTYLEGVGYAKNYSTNRLRSIFSSYIRRMENYVYEYSSDGRPLYQFNNHCLRHTAISLVGEFLKDPYKIGCYSRHSTQKLVGVQAVYRHYRHEIMRCDLEEVFCVFRGV